MAKGFDTIFNCGSRATYIKNEGYAFVARYYSACDISKNLTLAEAQALSQAGLSVVAVWESGNPTCSSYFSYSTGVFDGTAAYHYAMHEIGQPAGSAIYFAVDFDASMNEIAGGVADYFRGIAAGFNTISCGYPVYSIGVYGSGCTCSFLLAHTQCVKYAWLSQSTGWCGHNTFSQWHIKQDAGSCICGIEVDLDESNGNHGGFMV